MKNPKTGYLQKEQLQISLNNKSVVIDQPLYVQNSLNEIAKDGFFTVDNHWNILCWNKEMQEISGLSRDEAIGKGLWNFFNNQGSIKLYSECRRAKQQNVSTRYEDFYPAQESWMEVHAYPTDNGMTVFIKLITDLKKAEAAMRLSKERYDMVVKATNDLVWDWDIITGEIYRNDAGIERVYGHKSNETIKTNQLWINHIHPNDKKQIDLQIAYYISSESESAFSFEYRFRREDGLYNYINDRGYIIRNDLGIVTRMIGAARDITAEKQAAINIEESELRYRTFLQQSTEGIWRIELDEPVSIDKPNSELMEYCLLHGYVAECNDAFAKMYGFHCAGEVIGIRLEKLMHLENPVNDSYFEKFFNNGFKVQEELSYEVDRFGNKLTFLNNMLGIVEDGLLSRAWGTQRDVTEQKRSEAKLLSSEAKYRDLFNNNPCCMMIWNLDDLRIVKVNQAAIDIYGYSSEDFKKLTVLDIRPSEEHAEFLQMVELAIENNDYKKTTTWRHNTYSGACIFLEISCQAVTYNGKKCLLAIGNNVTDKIQLENSLNFERLLKQKQITDAVITGQERERSKLGEELHDNINQILASTRLYVECALTDENIRKDLLEKTKNQLDTAMAEIRKLSKSLVAPSLGGNTLLQSIDDLIDDMSSIDHMTIEKELNNFNENNLNEKLKLTIFRIIQEQLNNIHRHSKANKVFVNLTMHDEFLSLTITDNGKGFDPAAKKNGVGLRNISSRAEVNNGSVKIETTPGKGCKLIVTFTT